MGICLRRISARSSLLPWYMITGQLQGRVNERHTRPHKVRQRQTEGQTQGQKRLNWRSVGATLGHTRPHKFTQFTQGHLTATIQVGDQVVPGPRHGLMAAVASSKRMNNHETHDRYIKTEHWKCQILWKVAFFFQRLTTADEFASSVINRQSRYLGNNFLNSLIQFGRVARGPV